GIRFGNFQWVDYDSDGDLDIFLSGEIYSNEGYIVRSILFKNEGSNVFVEQKDIEIIGSTVGTRKWCDIDSDGDMDIIIYDQGNFFIYHNQNNLFYLQSNSSIEVFGSGFFDCGDYDNDGRLDLLIAESYNYTQTILRVYKNSDAIINTAPLAPANLNSTVKNNSVSLKWNSSSDVETNKNSLTYNLQVDSISGGSGIVSPMANMNSGYRRKPGNGSLRDTSWTLQGLQAGEYFCKVQAVDQGYLGSGFSEEISFTITHSNKISPETEQELNLGENGVILSVDESFISTHRQWRYSISPGGPYNYLLEGESNKEYTPKFFDDAKYYVICVSYFDTDSIISNEVEIYVPRFKLDTTQALINLKDSSFDWGDYDDDGDMDLVASMEDSTIIIKNNLPDSLIFSVVTEISLYGAKNGCAIWGDYNNDNLLDILVAGDEKTIIYKHNPDHSFTEIIGLNFIGLANSSAAFGDYNNDGNLDFAISGDSENGEKTFKIFRNDKNDTFQELEVSITPFSEGSIDWGDYDNDSDLDLLISGTDYSGNRMTKIYRNIGFDTFKETDDEIINVKTGKAAWLDHNNDCFLDILVYGYSATENYVTKIYTNNAGLNFTEPSNIDLFGLEYTSNLSWGDYDNDGDYDIIIDDALSVKLYQNNGANGFKSNTVNNFNALTGSKLTWNDYDNDGDLDVLFLGEEGIRIYENTAVNANNSPSIPLVLESRTEGNTAVLSWSRANDFESTAQGLSYNVLVSSTINGFANLSPMSNIDNGYRQINKTGNAFYDTTFHISNLDLGKYYWRVQALDHNLAASAFSIQDSFELLPTFTSFDSVIDYDEFNMSQYDDFALGDYDNDGDLDILATGGMETEVYMNCAPDSSVFFKLYRWTNAAGNGSVAWGDYDNDGDLDAYILCLSRTKLFTNLGNGQFSEDTRSNFPDLSQGSAAWGDYNNDGRIDLLLTGIDNYNEYAVIYQNLPDNTFTEVDVGLEPLFNGDAKWGDYDKDGDLDIVLTGQKSAKIYRNDGDNNFIDINAPLVGMYNGSVSWGDYDSDGDLDILINGRDDYYEKYTKIYRNDNNDVFTDINAFVRGVTDGQATWGDFENDGDLDILVSGVSGNSITEVYINGSENEYKVLGDSLPGFSSVTARWGDFDNDNDLDILLASRYARFKIIQNNGNWRNEKPSPPKNLKFSRFGFGAHFSWDRSTDDKTDSIALSYNIRIGTDSDGCDIISSGNYPTNTGLTTPQLGNCQLNTSYYLDSLPQGKYYWSVQAVDNSFLGGEWASEQSFTISVILSDYEADTVCLGVETTFIDQTNTSVDPITEWKWDFGDGSTSTLQNPVHTYAIADTFIVHLIAISSQYSDTITKQVIVKPKPIANLSADLVCQGINTSFINSTDANGLSISNWKWDFGDGSTSTEENPIEHGYLNIGNYTAQLIATAYNGCSDTIQKTVTVAGYPSKSVSVDGALQFCAGDSVILTAEYDDLYNYQWLLSGAHITGADSSKFAALESGNYSVRITNSIGSCVSTSSETSVNVAIAPSAPKIIASGPVAFCSGDSVILSATDSPGYSYQWKNNGGVVGNDTSIFIAKYSGIYTLEVANSTGCFVLSINQFEITVNPSPVLPAISPGGPTTFCEGSTVELSATINPACTYQWKNSEGNISGQTGTSLTASTSEKYYLEVTSSDGCIVETVPRTVTVNPIPVAPTISAGSSLDFCEGDSVVLSVSDNAGYTYQWQLNGGGFGTKESSILVKNSGNYSVIIPDQNDCSSSSFNIISVDVIPTPKKPILNLSGQVTFCSGDDQFLYVTNFNTQNQYRWLVDGAIIGDQSNKILLGQSGSYSVEASNDFFCNSLSEITQATILDDLIKPEIEFVSGDSLVCPDDEVILAIEDSDQSFTYQWQESGDSIPGAVSTEYEITKEGKYSVLVSTAALGCNIKSDPIEINYKPALANPGITAEGPNVWYLACSNDSAEVYRWYYEDLLIEESDEHIYVANQQLGKYRVEITDDGECYSSSDVISIPENVVLGIDNIDPWENLKIYPNPTPGLFTLEMDNA
ncbi:MAG: FG-GAP-like repeat-containing protein, partial [Bacteroidales bacterium]|nr:FG-GAP-like repeat-containing protein [Bacteroidales bacterium]